MFLDILMTNRAAVLAQLARFQTQLGALHDLLAADDEAGLRATLSASQQARAGWKPRRGG
jgi:prephenate dehydrogenase